MGQVTVTLSENPLANSNAGANVGTSFAAGLTDQGPTTATQILSLGSYINTYGARSTASAPLYDHVEHFFANGGSTAWIVRVSDSTATTASLTLLDSTAKPTVTVSALTPGVDGNQLHIIVTGTTLEVEDSSGDLLESHSFAGNNAALIAAGSAYVNFTQATATGNTTNAPATLASTALSGGADATDITDASYINALNSFAPGMGPGTVSLPGRTSAACVTALFEHGAANNRFAVGDQVDAATSASAISALNALAIPASVSKAGIVVQGSLLKPTTGGATKTVAGSAAVAALRAQVAATGGNPPAAFAANGSIDGLAGFTTAFNNQTPGEVVWTQNDANAMADAGLCYFGYEGFGSGAVPCLDEFVTPDTQDDVFFEATAWTASMMLVAACQQVGAEYKGAVLDGQGTLITGFHGALSAVVQRLFSDNVLYGDTADDAASITTGSPVNTTATAQLGQLNADIAARLSPYADQVAISIDVLALTQTVGASV